MFELKGKYNTCKVMAEDYDTDACTQLINMMSSPAMKECTDITVMPDYHKGKGSVTGLTMKTGNRIDPAWIGPDIGCGMVTIFLEETWEDIDLIGFDRKVRQLIPSGAAIRGTALPEADVIEGKLENLIHIDGFKIDRALKAFGTLGGGNHFVELGIYGNRLALTIHSGSRCVGGYTAWHYKKLACQTHTKGPNSWLEGTDLEDYIDDMYTACVYAKRSRNVMGTLLINALGLHETKRFHTVHNYIDKNTGILRKGAVAAENGRALTIPLNMKDGVLLCKGLGSKNWNMSAPHGAGRRMSRSDARETLSMRDYIEDMQGIYSTTVMEHTIDESPRAYKPAESITAQLAASDTVDIKGTIKPVYNFKPS